MNPGGPGAPVSPLGPMGPGIPGLPVSPGWPYVNIKLIVRVMTSAALFEHYIHLPTLRARHRQPFLRHKSLQCAESPRTLSNKVLV